MASVFCVHCPSFQTIVVATGGTVLARPTSEPTSLTTDTRDPLEGACFVALVGQTFDGHAFVVKAATAAATAPRIQARLACDSGLGRRRGLRKSMS